jgi:hypothetical protein
LARTKQEHFSDAIAGAGADMDGRRCDDLTGDLAAASQPNLSQSEIDAPMKPAKVAP